MQMDDLNKKESSIAKQDMHRLTNQISALEKHVNALTDKRKQARDKVAD